jgi:spermidine/putrescine transport system permease protein
VAWLTQSLYLSLLTPEIVTGVSLLVLFQWVFHFLHLHLGMPTVILAHISFSLAYVVIVILARLRTFDIALEEAALDLGANEWQVFCRITVPIIMPGVLAAALLCFTVSFDDYVITSLVAGVNSETLPMIIYGLARKGVSPDINALSMLITCGLGILILLAGRLEQKA